MWLDLLADLDLHQGGVKPGLAVCSAAARTFALQLVDLERHALGNQSFLPLGNACFVLVERHTASGAAMDCEVIPLTGVRLDGSLAETGSVEDRISAEPLS